MFDIKLIDMNKLDLSVGDILISLDDWTKYDLGFQNHTFIKGNKYKYAHYCLEYKCYTVESEIYIYSNRNCNLALLTEEEIIEHFDYKSIQRKRKLEKLNIL